MRRLSVGNAAQLSLPLEAPARTTPPVATDGRHARIGAELVSYRLRRARRRTIGFQIDDRGLTVSAPRWVSLREIEAAIVEKGRWIQTRQRDWLAWREKNRLPQVRFIDGSTLPVLGVPVTLRLGLPTPITGLDAAANELRLGLPAQAEEPQVRDAVQSWLQGEARRVFGERIANFADRIDARFAGWTLSSARSQWGSCTHDGRVRLSWRLIHFAMPIIDYVIAHELAHLEELNHSPRFWRAVARLLPGFEAARDEIRGVEMAALPL